MKLNLKGCRAYCEEHSIGNYLELSKALGLNVIVIKLLEQGVPIGYDAVRDIYNKLGEKVTLKIIDFGEETLNGFKSKYVLVGDTLY